MKYRRSQVQSKARALPENVETLRRFLRHAVLEVRCTGKAGHVVARWRRDYNHDRSCREPQVI
jgi:hypothetical protein